jgi:hypothetical protein
LIFEYIFELQQFELLHIMGMSLCLASSTQIICNVKNNEWMASPWWVFTSMLTKKMNFGTNIMNGVYKWWSSNKNDSLFSFLISPSTHFTLGSIPILGWISKPWCWIIFWTNSHLTNVIILVLWCPLGFPKNNPLVVCTLRFLVVKGKLTI